VYTAVSVVAQLVYVGDKTMGLEEIISQETIDTLAPALGEALSTAAVIRHPNLAPVQPEMEAALTEVADDLVNDVTAAIGQTEELNAVTSLFKQLFSILGEKPAIMNLLKAISGGFIGDLIRSLRDRAAKI